MLELIVTAYGIGIIGSFHCVGMCGPLALSLPLNNQNTNSKIWGALLYNIGRVVTYSLFGLIFGLIGKTFSFFGFQQWLSIVLGAAIIIYVVFGKRIGKNISYPTSVNKFFFNVRNALSKLYSPRRTKNFSSLFAIGLLNGLLPCGLVYIAAAGAVSTGSVAHSIIFMAAFGLGTLPAMWSIAFFGNYIGIKIRQRIKNIYPYIMVCMAGLLIIRGLGLGIHYISPTINTKNNSIEKCHDNHSDKFCKIPVRDSK